LPELHPPRDGKKELFKLVNQTKRRFNLVGNLGSAIISASTLILPGDGDFFHVTGGTAVDFIDISLLADGDPVEFYFDAGLTLDHATASPPTGTYALKLAGSVNAVLGAGAKMRLRRDDSLGVMVEMWRGAP
jgi:hypothetical protein